MTLMIFQSGMHIHFDKVAQVLACMVGAAVLEARYLATNGS